MSTFPSWPANEDGYGEYDGATFMDKHVADEGEIDSDNLDESPLILDELHAAQDEYEDGVYRDDDPDDAM